MAVESGEGDDDGNGAGTSRGGGFAAVLTSDRNTITASSTITTTAPTSRATVPPFIVVAERRGSPRQIALGRSLIRSSGHLIRGDTASRKEFWMPAPHPLELRQRAVELARMGEKPVSAIARDLGISESCLRNWMNRVDVGEGQGMAPIFEWIEVRCNPRRRQRSLGMHSRMEFEAPHTAASTKA